MHPGGLLPLGIERAQAPTTSPESTKLPVHTRAISKHMHIEQQIRRHSLPEARARKKKPGRIWNEKSGPEQRAVGCRLSQL
eukprot:3194017-Pyramimonas_sp.AAC.1